MSGRQGRRAIRLEPFEPIVELFPPEPALEAEAEADAVAGVEETESAAAQQAAAPAAGQNSCLYLGPQGQRCWRRAGPGGFCDRHAPAAFGAEPAPQPGPWLRRLVALLVASGLLGPLVVEMVREWLRWLWAHR